MLQQRLDVGREPDEPAARRPAETVLDTALETFEAKGSHVVRRVKRRDGSVAESRMGEAEAVAPGPVAASVADRLLLRATAWPEAPATKGTLRLADLFSGCGGLTLGVTEACRALGLGCDVRLAVDFEPPAMDVFAANFDVAKRMTEDVTQVFDGRYRGKTTSTERAVSRAVGDVDLLIGGPPCQGHSDLNNRTRRADGKNELYFSMVRAAEVLGPQHVFIENVPGALNDRGAVVQRSMEALSELGYAVSYGVVDLSLVGVPQTRRRLVVLASRTRSLNVESVASAYSVPVRSVAWAIEDLIDTPAGTLLDAACNSAPATRRRIEYLFHNGLYELPDSERPPCHAGGGHSYASIYGRLRWDAPSQTVTTGFYSMCMGRYVHPSQPRTLTAHEAARLQLFPDYFDFSAVRRRGELATMIGNAVPMKLSYIFALEMLR